MNFARVICDRRAAQSIMRNIAFALQAGNQHASVRCLNVCRYRRASALKFVLHRTRRKRDRQTGPIESIGENRSAKNQQRSRRCHIDISTLRHDRVDDGARKLDRLRSTPLAFAPPKAKPRHQSGPKETIPSDLASRGISTFPPRASAIDPKK